MAARYATKSNTPSAEAETPTAPDLAALLKARLDGGERQTVRIPVCLNPQLYTDRAELLAVEYDADDTATEAKVLADIKAVDEQIRASSVRVTLRPITPAVEFANRVRVIGDRDPMDVPHAELWTANLSAAFVEARTMTGEEFPHLTREAFTALLSILSHGELQQLWRRLEQAAAEPDFPSQPMR